VTRVGVFGDDPREDPVLTRFARGRSEVVGSVYGEIDGAMPLSLKAELIVSLWYPPPDFGFRTASLAARATRLT
jgi:hypothetical protein